MRSMTITAILLSVAGCSDQMNETYATYADAQRAGAIARGWVPAFVPSSARDIADSHNLDTNRQTLQFTIPPPDISRMVARLSSVSAKDQRAAAELSKKHRFGADAQTYIVCSKPLNGALAVDRQNGRSVYDTGIEWADDDCS